MHKKLIILIICSSFSFSQNYRVAELRLINQILYGEFEVFYKTSQGEESVLDSKINSCELYIHSIENKQ